MTIARLGIGLRPVVPSDHEALRAIELSPVNLTRWRHADEIPSPSAHQALLWHGVLEQRVIVAEGTGELLGLVNAHRVDLRSGFAWLGLVEREELHGHGAGMMGMALFVDWLFDQWPLRKLFAEVDERNLDQFAHVRQYMHQEGTLTGRLLDPEFGPRSAVLFALDRNDWIATGRKHIRGRPPYQEPAQTPSVANAISVVREFTGLSEDVTSETHLVDDLGLDSLAMIVLLDQIEERLGLQVNLADGAPLSTVGDILNRLFDPNPARPPS